MPTGRNHAFSGVVNGKIYVIGGRIGHGFVTTSSNTDVVEEYDPAQDMWGVAKARMITPRSGGGWATYNGKIYVSGGEYPERALQRRVSIARRLRSGREPLGDPAVAARARCTATPSRSSATSFTRSAARWKAAAAGSAGEGDGRSQRDGNAGGRDAVMRTTALVIVTFVLGAATAAVFMGRGSAQAPATPAPAAAGGFSAVPNAVGTQDVTGPYEVVKGWPKDISTLPGNAEMDLRRGRERVRRNARTAFTACTAASCRTLSRRRRCYCRRSGRASASLSRASGAMRRLRRCRASAAPTRTCGSG